MKAALFVFALSGVFTASLCCGGETPPSAPSPDWPQWRGPNRDGVAPASPKLLDTWPKDGPPLLWKSEWIPSCEEGGCSHPLVADGRVFVYSNAKRSVDGGDGYRFVTDELLADAGWLPDLPEALAKKIEEAWASPQRPSSTGWQWYNSKASRTPAELDAFLAKKPELGKYISDFSATLSPEDAKKYGDYVKRRLCIDPKGRWGVPCGLSWEALAKLSKLRDVRHRTRREWDAELEKISREAVSLCENFPHYYFWNRVFTMSDTLFCLDAATGKTLWRKDFAEDWAMAATNAKNVQWWCFDSLGASGTPAVANGRCYVAGALGLYCFSAKDGTLLWQAKGEPVHSSPVVADGVVYDAGRGCAYDAENGQLLWKNPFWPQGRWPVKDDQYRWNSPLLWTSGDKAFVITTDGGISQYCCLEMKTGKTAWTLKTPIGTFATIRGDILITPPPYGGSGTRAFKLTPAAAEPLWKKSFADGWGDVVYQGHLYLQDRCVDLQTGETNWRSRIGIDSIAPLVLADGKIFTQLGSSHQITKQWGGGYSMAMFKATPEKFVELGRFNPHACHMCSPAFSNGKLYVRLLDSLACYDLQDHGVYLENAAATKDALTFRFKQTGGGLVAKNGALDEVLIFEGAAAPKPARAKIDGENLLVDTNGAALPFSVSYAGATLAGKNGQAVPAFTWNAAHLLRQRKCFENTLVLTSDHPFDSEGGWNKPETYALAGAKVIRAEIDPDCKNINLTTDKTWKPGESVSLSYACFPVSRGEPRRGNLSFTVAEPQRAAAKFIRLDETTSGTWKGVYGSEGALISGDKTSAAPAFALVTPVNKSDLNPWAASPADTRYPQTWADANNRSIVGWHAPDEFDVGVELTDGKEHQVALYCLDADDRTVLKVEVLDADTMSVIDTQTVQTHHNGKYAVWNLKGGVVFRISNTRQEERTSAMAYGMFFDAVKAAK